VKKNLRVLLSKKQKHPQVFSVSPVYRNEVGKNRQERIPVWLFMWSGVSTPSGCGHVLAVSFFGRGVPKNESIALQLIYFINHSQGNTLFDFIA
jgi:hypothetical protein